MNDLDTTASVGAAQATVDDGGEDVNNSEINDDGRLMSFVLS